MGNELNVTGRFDQFSSQIYKTPFASYMGTAEHEILRFAEKFALQLLKTIDWVRDGQDHKEKEFRAKLFQENEPPEEGTAFLLTDIQDEKNFVELLEENHVINDKGTWESKVELIAKIALNILFLTVTLPVSLPAGGIALGLRCYVQNEMEPLICVPPGSHKKWSPYHPITLLTLNIASTEFQIMDYINGVSDTRLRAPEIAEFLANQNTDFITLQEAFDVDELDPIVVKTLHDKNYYVVMLTKRRQITGMTGGLLLASKFPIDEVGFHQFEHCEGIDKHVCKGVLYAIVQLNEDHRICVAGTHMQAGFSSDEKNANLKNKQQQFDEVTTFLNKQLQGKDVRDVIFMGDYNVGRFNRGEDLDQACKNSEYPAMEDALIKPGHHGEGFKDLTVPDRKVSFKNYVSAETDFNIHDPKNQETGNQKGTVFDTTSTSYTNFKELIYLFAAESITLKKTKLMKLIEQRLAGEGICSQTFSKIIDSAISKVKAKVYRKPEACDHISLKNKPNNIFDEKYYWYQFLLPTGKSGLISDHGAVKVKLFPRENEESTQADSYYHVSL